MSVGTGISLVRALCLLTPVLWVLLSSRFLQPALEQAYRAEDHSVLTPLLQSRGELPLDHYLDKWRRISAFILLTSIGAAAGVLAFTFPRFRQAWRDSLHPTCLAELCRLEGSRTRRVAVNALIGIIVFGHLAAIAFDKEIWPWSQYPMYAYMAGPQVEFTGLAGITEDGGEVMLFENKYWRPLGRRTRVALLRMSRGERTPEEIQRAMRHLMERYEIARREGLHDGPVIYGLRLSTYSWEPDTTLSNRSQPARRRILIEHRLDSQPQGAV